MALSRFTAPSSVEFPIPTGSHPCHCAARACPPLSSRSSLWILQRREFKGWGASRSSPACGATKTIHINTPPTPTLLYYGSTKFRFAAASFFEVGLLHLPPLLKKLKFPYHYIETSNLYLETPMTYLKIQVKRL